MGEVRNVELTKEMKKKIRSYCAIDVHKTFEYTPKAFKDFPSELKPVFTLRRLDGQEELDVLKQCSQVDASSAEISNVDWGKYSTLICKSGIRGWHTYYDENGTIVDYNEDCKGLSKTLIYEICTAISADSALDDDEVSGLK